MGRKLNNFSSTREKCKIQNNLDIRESYMVSGLLRFLLLTCAVLDLLLCWFRSGKLRQRLWMLRIQHSIPSTRTELLASCTSWSWGAIQRGALWQWRDASSAAFNLLKVMLWSSRPSLFESDGTRLQVNVPNIQGTFTCISLILVWPNMIQRSSTQFLGSMT